MKHVFEACERSMQAMIFLNMSTKHVNEACDPPKHANIEAVILLNM
jgi:hypothetical protein